MAARILIVEDERIAAEDLREILTGLGYIVTASVDNGEDAIARAGDTYPDLALMDLRIKGKLDGAETALVLREHFQVPVIYLTAQVDTATLSRAKLSEPLGCIAKPFCEAELYSSIEIALHKNQADRRSRQREEMLLSTIHAIGDGVISVDGQERVTVFNQAAEEWTGAKSLEALGRHLNEVFPLIDSSTGEDVETPLWRVLSEGTSHELSDDICVVDRSGKRRPVHGFIAPAKDRNDQISGAVLVFGPRMPRTLPAADPGPVVCDPKDDFSGADGFRLIAVSSAMRDALKFARRVAESEVSTILLEGESGTGKDLFARFLHHYGRRRAGPFVPLNCAAIPETLLESELFGYDKGAFTDARSPKAGIFEIATGGTIFLDEIGEMPIVVQAKLLRALEDQTFRHLGGVRDIQVDVRVVAATNRKLTEAIEQGKFRLDLYYRLNVIQIQLPPLRERAEDILPLAESFIRLYNLKFRRDVHGLSHGAAALLLSHDWPGNVRELRNVIERAMVLEESSLIQALNLRVDRNSMLAAPPVVEFPSKEVSFEMSLEDAERGLLQKALQKAGGNQTRAAVLLGITRDTLRYKMRKLNLREPAV